ncbi:MAG: EI24 domain-containing protein [Myxococcota bacterium]
MHPVSQFLRGMGAPFRGLRIIAANRPLWPLAVAPGILTGLLLVIALYVALTSAGSVAVWLLPWVVKWRLLYILARGAMTLLLGLLFGGFAMMLSALVCLPIHDALSQRVEALQDTLPPPLSFGEALPTSILHSVMSFGLWLVLEAVVAPVQLIPVLGSLLELVLGFGLTAFFLGHQLVDGPMSRRSMAFGEKMAWLRAHLPYVLGLGATGTLLIAVPFVNAFCLPIAIAGGTLLFLELHAPSASAPEVGVPAAD